MIYLEDGQSRCRLEEPRCHCDSRQPKDNRWEPNSSWNYDVHTHEDCGGGDCNQKPKGCSADSPANPLRSFRDKGNVTVTALDPPVHKLYVAFRAEHLGPPSESRPSDPRPGLSSSRLTWQSGVDFHQPIACRVTYLPGIGVELPLLSSARALVLAKHKPTLKLSGTTLNDTMAS